MDWANIEDTVIESEKIEKKLDDILEDMIITEEMQSVIDIIAKDEFKMIFLTGKAGTGKSVFLKYLKNKILKNAVFLAPTGIASINIGGQTIHSFFKFKHHFNSYKLQRPLGLEVKDRDKYKKIKYLVIDEISMVRADIFDSINTFLQANRNNYGEFFGGVKVILFGDLFQLPPIVNDDDKFLFKKFNYATPYFFSSDIFKQICKKTHYINFTHIFRQKDNTFIDVLENIRNSKFPKEIENTINSRVIKRYSDLPEGSMILSTVNKVADQYNKKFLDDLPTKSKVYVADIRDKFNISDYPTKEKLELKVGAQVMFVKNDTQKRFVNGTIGKIKWLSEEHIGVEINGIDNYILRETWEKREYVDKKSDELETVSVGSFTQFPIKYGWAISIHKSQGLTFDNVLIDTANNVFASGQIYVALSRCRTLEGIYLRHKITKDQIFKNNYIEAFLKYIEQMKYEREIANGNTDII